MNAPSRRCSLGRRVGCSADRFEKRRRRSCWRLLLLDWRQLDDSRRRFRAAVCQVLLKFRGDYLLAEAVGAIGGGEHGGRSRLLGSVYRRSGSVACRSDPSIFGRLRSARRRGKLASDILLLLSRPFGDGARGGWRQGTAGRQPLDCFHRLWRSFDRRQDDHFRSAAFRNGGIETIAVGVPPNCRGGRPGAPTSGLVSVEVRPGAARTAKDGVLASTPGYRLADIRRAIEL